MGYCGKELPCLDRWDRAEISWVARPTDNQCSSSRPGYADDSCRRSKSLARPAHACLLGKSENHNGIKSDRVKSHDLFVALREERNQRLRSTIVKRARVSCSNVSECQIYLSDFLDRISRVCGRAHELFEYDRVHWDESHFQAIH